MMTMTLGGAVARVYGASGTPRVDGDLLSSLFKFRYSGRRVIPERCACSPGEVQGRENVERVVRSAK